MTSNEKQLLNTSLEKYEGISTNIRVRIGQEYYKNSLKENIVYSFENEQIKMGKILIRDYDDSVYEIVVFKKDFTSKKEISYYIDISKQECYFTKVKTKLKMKNKYQKEIYKSNKALIYINNLGITTAQMAHAQDIEIEEYVSLRNFLKVNPKEFQKKTLYSKNLNDKIDILRHKNLFSQFKDEISDFEKFTYFERNEDGLLQVSYNIDEKILDYDQESATLIDRKNARFFAKDIYNKKGIFTDKELLKILKGQDIYIKVKKILSANNKLNWDKVKVEDMNIKVLKTEFLKEYKNKDERLKNVQLKYLSKRDRKRKKRRTQKHFIKEGMKEYFVKDTNFKI